MKKYLLVITALCLAAFLTAGCQQAATTPATDAPDSLELAASIGGMMQYSTAVDNTATSLMGITAGAAGLIDGATASELTYSGGWWNFTYSASVITYTFKVRVYDADDTEITDSASFADANKISMALTMSIGSSATYAFGTEANPLTFDGLSSGVKSIDGLISVDLTDETGSTYVVSIAYSAVELDASGYPASGSATFSFTSSDYATVAGTVTFNGSTATVAYTAPSEYEGLSYTVDLTTGAATPASL
ncbi:MAG: hypothetical protein ABH823_02170 [bacterium]